MQPILISVGRGRAARRGFTMVELLVALVLLGLVSAALYRVLVNNQRLYMAQTQRIDLSQNIRAAANILPAELREIDASEGDIVSMTPTRLEIRAMRWLGFACVQPAMGGVLTPITMVIRGGTPGQPLFFGARGINIATDTMLIYYDGDPTSRNDDYWARGEFTGVAPAAVNCPDPIVPPQPGRLVTFGARDLPALPTGRRHVLLRGLSARRRDDAAAHWTRAHERFDVSVLQREWRGDRGGKSGRTRGYHGARANGFSSTARRHGGRGDDRRQHHD